MDENEWKQLKLYPLSAQALDILTLLANGFAPADIITYRAQYKYADIQAAAQEALKIDGRIREIDAHRLAVQRRNDENSPDLPVDQEVKPDRYADIRQEYPRAYRSWSATEDQHLTAVFRSNFSTKEISKKLERQPGAIRSRLMKLGLVKPEHKDAKDD